MTAWIYADPPKARGRKERNLPPAGDRSKSATRIANTQKRLKEKAALLSKGALTKLQKPADKAESLGSRSPTAKASDDNETREELFEKSRKPKRLAVEENEAREELFEKSRRPLSGNKRAEGKAAGVAAKPSLTRLSANGDIVLEASSLDIPLVDEEASRSSSPFQATGALQLAGTLQHLVSPPFSEGICCPAIR